ncbi:PqqD family protein [Luteipulveratus halotolerans]|uniref:Pyrroloquinoline quinone biosynthesis protein PqqD n=1 Tax=Luteipulveratus halotolerans TaxID=1631356 RepID=A0A0L6CF32_9MICO|nr:PqqD family protein [Luteipulveratus halotolerans]KNX36185.1 hypothetical protein VV01_01920 [Luteipulveratus halotolerans]
MSSHVSTPRWRPHPDVLVVAGAGRFVVLPPGAAQPLVLDGTAADAWEALSRDATLDDVCDHLCAVYAADRDVVRASVIPLIDRLFEQGALAQLAAAHERGRA